jgi:hypothetical protein
MVSTQKPIAGGQQYLLKQAHKNPIAFMILVGKVLPTQITGGARGDQPVTITYCWADAAPTPSPNGRDETS